MYDTHRITTGMDNKMFCLAVAEQLCCIPEERVRFGQSLLPFIIENSDLKVWRENYVQIVEN